MSGARRKRRQRRRAGHARRPKLKSGSGAPAEARFAAASEARAAAEAEEATKAKRAAKREEAKTRAAGDPETVKAWLNSKRVIHSPGNVLSLPAAYADYEADCRAHDETPVARGRWFADELRKHGVDVRERGNRKRFEVHGLTLSHAERPALRVVSSR
jgi:hypothetical protein